MTFALAAKAGLLTAGVAVDDHAKVQLERDATSPWAAEKKLRRSSAQHLCR